MPVREVTRPQKPRDVGNGIVCASFGRAGEWLSLATVDSEAGFVELTGLPLFDPELRGNAEAVLRYRSWMRREEHAFLRIEAGRAGVVTREDAPRGTRSVVQRLVISAGRLDRPRRHPPAPDRAAGTADPCAASARGRCGRRPRRGRVPRQAQAGHPPRHRRGAARHRPGLAAPRRPSGRRSAEGAPTCGWRGARLRRRMPSAVAWLDWPADAEEVHLDLACTFDLAVPETPDWLGAHGNRPTASPAGREPDVRPTAAAGPRDDARPLRVPARLVKAIGSIDQRAATYVRDVHSPARRPWRTLHPG